MIVYGKFKSSLKTTARLLKSIIYFPVRVYVYVVRYSFTITNVRFLWINKYRGFKFREIMRPLYRNVIFRNCKLLGKYDLSFFYYPWYLPFFLSNFRKKEWNETVYTKVCHFNMDHIRIIHILRVIKPFTMTVSSL